MSRKFFAFLLFVALLAITRPFFLPGHNPYFFILWNLFLAAIPYFVALIQKKLSTPPVLSFIGWCLWLLFFPNAPYIITDLIHLDHSRGFDWYDTILILSAGIAGLKFAYDSLDMLVDNLELVIPRIPRWIWDFTFLGLAAYGVYLGRYLRFNSWDLFHNPSGLISACLDLFIHPLSNLREWSMIGLFTFFLIGIRQIWPKEKLQEA